jgi:hypothetical protein
MEQPIEYYYKDIVGSIRSFEWPTTCRNDNDDEKTFALFREQDINIESQREQSAAHILA